jgi:guanylate kinase
MTGGASAPGTEPDVSPDSGRDVLRDRSAAPSGGLLVVISGPSGVGKGTVVRHLRERLADTTLSVSVTTRRPRQGDIPGVDYHFVDDERFDQMIDEDGLLEWAEVHGARYGTPRAPVEAELAAGRTVLLEIDVQGALAVRERAPEALLIFLAPPSFAELERRLDGRGTETVEQQQQRLRVAEAEIAAARWFDRVIVNDVLPTCVDEIVEAIEAAR